MHILQLGAASSMDNIEVSDEWQLPHAMKLIVTNGTRDHLIAWATVNGAVSFLRRA